ncbi:MAG: hypothetical protein ACD_75C00184G0002 [uncultured bacterium]|nr:MAG: hypothetical protein ACD_75C00184G0002 [uncultured bacterium]
MVRRCIPDDQHCAVLIEGNRLASILGRQGTVIYARCRKCRIEGSVLIVTCHEGFTVTPIADISGNKEVPFGIEGDIMNDRIASLQRQQGLPRCTERLVNGAGLVKTQQPGLGSTT